MIPAAPLPDAFGPWVPNLPEAERLARWRAMRALALVLLGSEHALTEALRAAETDADAARRAFTELEALAPLPRRRLLATYLQLQELPRKATKARRERDRRAQTS